MGEREPVPISRILGRLIDAGGWHERVALGRLQTGWAAAVGDQIASHSHPVKLAEGMLLVRAESGPWAAELALLAGRLAERADGWLGGGVVREVKVVAGRDQNRR